MNSIAVHAENDQHCRQPAPWDLAGSEQLVLAPHNRGHIPETDSIARSASAAVHLLPCHLRSQTWADPTRVQGPEIVAPLAKQVVSRRPPRCRRRTTFFNESKTSPMAKVLLVGAFQIELPQNSRRSFRDCVQSQRQ